jgi:uncharacterized protein (DUF697 family)
MAAFGIPVDIKKVKELITGTTGQSTTPLKLELFVDMTVSPTLRSAAREAFRPDSSHLAVYVAGYAGGFEQESQLDPLPKVASDADLSVILANASTLTVELFLRLAAYQRPLVIVCEDAAAFIAAWPSDMRIDTSCLIAVSSQVIAERGPEALFESLAAWIIAALPDSTLAWARALGFVRQAMVTEVIQSTALLNGAIALAVFLPGADLPLLLFNQIRMYFKLAAMHGIDSDGVPYRELALLVAQAFAWRGLARRLITTLPMVGWAIKGTVGYGGTLALGKALEAYLRSSTAEQENPLQIAGGLAVLPGSEA